MIDAVRAWRAILLAVFLAQVANGLQSTSVALQADARLDGTGLAVVLSAFYAGQIAGSLVVGRIIARFGHRVAYAGLAILAGAILPLFLAAEGAAIWAATRFLLGCAFAGLFVTVESWLNDRTPNETRGLTFAIYIQAQLVAIAVGQFAAPLAGAWFAGPVLAAAALMALSAVPVVAGRAPEAARHGLARMDLVRLAKASPLGVFGVAMAGFIWAAVAAAAPVYAQRSGLPPLEISAFLACAVAGGIALQVPIGWLSDHRDRRVVLAASCGVAAAAALTGAWLGGGAAFAAFAVYGGLTFPIYTLCVAHVNDRIAAPERVAAAGAMVLLFAIGSTFGPGVATAAMEAAGPGAYFLTLAAAAAALAAFALWRRSARPAPRAA